MLSMKIILNSLRQGDFLHMLGIWNYILLSFLVIVEGPIATLLGAIAASGGYMRPILVFLVASLSNLCSDLLWYTLGVSGKIEWILHVGKHVGLRNHHVKRLERSMLNHAAKIIFIAKLTNGFSLAALVAAGLTRVPIKRWLPSLAIAETIWTGTLVLIGFYTTQAITKVERGMETIIMITSALFLIGILIWARHALKQQEEQDDIITFEEIKK